jgi:hypothetical protein
MLRRLPILLVAAWAALNALSPAFAADTAGAGPVFPKGVRIAPPGDFKPSTHFPGFEDPDRDARISILELPLPAFRDIERSVFASNQGGLTDVKRESFPFQSGIGFLLSGHAQKNGVELRVWFLAATGIGPQYGDLAVLIKVELPEAAAAVYTDAAIRKALESVTFRTAPIDEQLVLLPFKVKDLAGLRVMKVLGHDGVILIEGPTSDIIGHPYMIISLGRGVPDDADARARFARELLGSAPLRDITVTLAEPIRIGGRPGYEVRANAVGPDRKPLALVQWLRFGGGAFLRVIGVVHKENWDQWFPRFRQVRDGVDWR